MEIADREGTRVVEERVMRVGMTDRCYGVGSLVSAAVNRQYRECLDYRDRFVSQGIIKRRIREGLRCWG